MILARMDVRFPGHLTPEQVAEFQVRGKAHSTAPQESSQMAGSWRSSQSTRTTRCSTSLPPTNCTRSAAASRCTPP